MEVFDVAHLHSPVEAPRTQQGAVQDVLRAGAGSEWSEGGRVGGICVSKV